MSPTTASRMLAMLTPMLEFDCGKSAPVAPDAAQLERACSIVAPGRSRPIAPRLWNFRTRLTSRSSGVRSSGVKISASATVGKKKLGGSTPTTVRDLPLILMAFPTMALSLPKTRRQAPKPSTIVGLTPVESSPTAKVRPR